MPSLNVATTPKLLVRASTILLFQNFHVFNLYLIPSTQLDGKLEQRFNKLKQEDKARYDTLSVFRNENDPFIIQTAEFLLEEVKK